MNKKRDTNTKHDKSKKRCKSKNDKKWEQKQETCRILAPTTRNGNVLQDTTRNTRQGEGEMAT